MCEKEIQLIAIICLFDFVCGTENLVSSFDFQEGHLDNPVGRVSRNPLERGRPMANTGRWKLSVCFALVWGVTWLTPAGLGKPTLSAKRH